MQLILVEELAMAQLCCDGYIRDEQCALLISMNDIPLGDLVHGGQWLRATSDPWLGILSRTCTVRCFAEQESLSRTLKPVGGSDVLIA